MHFVKQKHKLLIKKKRNRIWKISHTVLERRTLCSYQNRQVNVKLWRVGACERKKRTFFVPLVLSKGNCFNIYVLFQCSVLNTLSEYTDTFTHEKILIHVFLLVFESLQYEILKASIYFDQDTSMRPYAI